MSIYQISYDLRKQRDYEVLFERIKASGSWCHALESCWLVATRQTAAQLRDYLRPALDADDGLLVIKVSSEAAWYGLSREVGEWLKSQLSALPA